MGLNLEWQLKIFAGHGSRLEHPVQSGFRVWSILIRNRSDPLPSLHTFSHTQPCALAHLLLSHSLAFPPYVAACHRHSSISTAAPHGLFDLEKWVTRRRLLCLSASFQLLALDFSMSRGRVPRKFWRSLSSENMTLG